MLKYTSDNQDITDEPISGTEILGILKGMDEGLYEFFKGYDYSKEDKLKDVEENAIKGEEFLYVCEKGYIELIDELIEAGVDIDIQDENGWTGLMYASINGHVEVIKRLIDRSRYR